MSISAVSGSNPLYTDFLSMLGQPVGCDMGSNAIVSGGQSNWTGGNTFMQSVTEALNQIGLSTPTPPSGVPSNWSSNLTSDSATSSTNPTQSNGGHGHGHAHGLGKFMHDLFEAIEEESGSNGSSSSSASSTASSLSSGGSSSSTSSTATSPYSNFSSKLEQLISQLEACSDGSSSTSSSNSSLSTLQTDFNNLVSALQPASGGSPSSSQSGTTASVSTSTNLQAFLQNLLANFGSTTTALATGNLINQYT